MKLTDLSSIERPADVVVEEAWKRDAQDNFLYAFRLLNGDISITNSLILEEAKVNIISTALSLIQ